ncbi:hypothetical protein DFH07DRAFT_1055966 [Mycena maculata]|uniref:Uncharacterized protein n=1 Tax=Mycena maculata TaxID=230809 RepID=A0AAD7KB13_9AGAR|nr:hypothetical protein DFH07DRAFT_1055966 [Mycena maculata]
MTRSSMSPRQCHAFRLVPIASVLPTIYNGALWRFVSTRALSLRCPLQFLCWIQQPLLCTR